MQKTTVRQSDYKEGQEDYKELLPARLFSASCSLWDQRWLNALHHSLLNMNPDSFTSRVSENSFAFHASFLFPHRHCSTFLNPAEFFSSLVWVLNIILPPCLWPPWFVLLCKTSKKINKWVWGERRDTVRKLSSRCFLLSSIAVSGEWQA